MTAKTYLSRLARTVEKQLGARRVGYLLGAGAAYLGGQGYPLASQLWPRIGESLDERDRRAIQRKLDQGASGLEQALDLLDKGGPEDLPLRHIVAGVIADLFRQIEPPMDLPRAFVKSLYEDDVYRTHVFSLNYDPLVERAAELERIRLIDGFAGAESAYFDPVLFEERIGIVRRHGSRSVIDQARGVINLYKLHGSIGWYYSEGLGIRRSAFTQPPPKGTQHLMIPPQRRKAADTGAPPYSNLWTEFRRRLIHGPDCLNRLVCIGYGLKDQHVNDVIRLGLGRSDFTLIVFSRALSADVFDTWSHSTKTILLTETASSLYGEVGPPHPRYWAFENLAERT
jgi:hypothetical protein